MFNNDVQNLKSNKGSAFHRFSQILVTYGDVLSAYWICLTSFFFKGALKGLCFPRIYESEAACAFCANAEWNKVVLRVVCLKKIEKLYNY